MLEYGYFKEGDFMNVVVIDNDVEQLDKLTDVLQGLYPGSSVSVFKDPMLAVKHVYNNQTDLVLSEIKTRPVSGYDVLRTLKRIKPELNVVLMSADSAVSSKAVELGASAFAAKPLSTDDIKSVVDKLPIH